MNTQPLISICIPTYNGAEYLSQAIESALRQTFKDVEILIVDDCSTDNTLELAQKFAQGDPRVKVFKNEQNLGLVGNWNKCVTMAQGTWIKFLFQDDYLAPTCLEEMMKSSANQMLVIANRSYVFEKGISKKDKMDYRKLERQFNFSTICKGVSQLNSEHFSKIIARYPGINIWGEPTSMLIHKDAFEKLGYFNALFKQTCDYEFWTRIGTNQGVSLVHQNLIYFRVHGKSTTMSNHEVKSYFVHFYDFFALIDKYCNAPEYENYRKHVGNQLPFFVDYELARHSQNLKKWQSSNSSFTQTLINDFPAFGKYFFNPAKELLRTQFALLSTYPLVFLSMVIGKLRSELQKLIR
ncbi:MAG: glycosyltransferase family 2 protein [Opitutaceae bacterium]|nr:glycosyltransferase family 2 protein [Cytophagales bacterium]